MAELEDGRQHRSSLVGVSVDIVMVTICIGPVCVPLHLLLPFLVGALHRYGVFKWFKQEWVTLRYWKSWWGGAAPKAAEVNAKPSVETADKAVTDAMKSKQQAPDGFTHSNDRTSGAAATSQQSSNKDADGLQGLQRPRGQTQKSSLSS